MGLWALHTGAQGNSLSSAVCLDPAQGSEVSVPWTKPPVLGPCLACNICQSLLISQVTCQQGPSYSWMSRQ